MLNTYRAGDLVVNFGQIALVSEVRGYGLILRNKEAGKWLADPSKCAPHNGEYGWAK